MSIEAIVAAAPPAEVIIGDEDGILVKAKLLVVGEPANVCEVVGLKSVERVAAKRHRQKQPLISAVEGRNVPAVGVVVVHHVGVAAGGRPEKLCERLVEQEGSRGLVENADLNVDRLDDKVVAHGRVRIRREVAAARVEEVNTIVALADLHSAMLGALTCFTGGKGAFGNVILLNWTGAGGPTGTKGPTGSEAMRATSEAKISPHATAKAVKLCMIVFFIVALR